SSLLLHAAEADVGVPGVGSHRTACAHPQVRELALERSAFDDARLRVVGEGGGPLPDVAGHVPGVQRVAGEWTSIHALRRARVAADTLGAAPRAKVHRATVRCLLGGVDPA